jgi:hypothetical protein
VTLYVVEELRLLLPLGSGSLSDDGENFDGADLSSSARGDRVRSGANLTRDCAIKS